MSRLTTALLVAYGASMTLVAAWLGCRSFIYQRLLSGTILGPIAGRVVSHQTIVDNLGAPRFLVGPVNEWAILIAGIEPPTVVTVIVVILFGCLGLTSLRRSKATPGSTLK